eukprot:scaffold845_cov364-Prasinococcus_capsulatus_cf.AAC.24
MKSYRLRITESPAIWTSLSRCGCLSTITSRRRRPPSKAVQPALAMMASAEAFEVVVLPGVSVPARHLSRAPALRTVQVGLVMAQHRYAAVLKRQAAGLVKQQRGSEVEGAVREVAQPLRSLRVLPQGPATLLPRFE